MGKSIADILEERKKAEENNYGGINKEKGNQRDNGKYSSPSNTKKRDYRPQGR